MAIVALGTRGYQAEGGRGVAGVVYSLLGGGGRLLPRSSYNRISALVSTVCLHVVPRPACDESFMYESCDGGRGRGRALRTFKHRPAFCAVDESCDGGRESTVAI